MKELRRPTALVVEWAPSAGGEDARGAWTFVGGVSWSVGNLLPVALDPRFQRRLDESAPDPGQPLSRSGLTKVEMVCSRFGDPDQRMWCLDLEGVAPRLLLGARGTPPSRRSAEVPAPLSPPDLPAAPITRATLDVLVCTFARSESDAATEAACCAVRSVLAGLDALCDGRTDGPRLASTSSDHLAVSFRRAPDGR